MTREEKQDPGPPEQPSKERNLGPLATARAGRRAVRRRLRPRRRLELLLALPAAAAIVGGVALSAALWRGANQTALQKQYETLAYESLAAGDNETARICFERLLQDQPEAPLYRAGLEASQQKITPAATH